MRPDEVDPEIGVNTNLIASVRAGFGAYHTVGSQYLRAEGILPATDDPAARTAIECVPLVRFLAAFAAIERRLGSAAIHDIGLQTPRNAIFPPDVTDIEAAIRSIDVAYRINHYWRGVRLCDLPAGTQFPGIGRYEVKTPAEPRRLLVEVDGPYLDQFDLGLFIAISRRFEPRARVVLAPDRPQRARGGRSSTYVVSW